MDVKAPHLLYNTNRKKFFHLKMYLKIFYIEVMHSMWYFESPVSNYNNWHSIEKYTFVT